MRQSPKRAGRRSLSTIRTHGACPGLSVEFRQWIQNGCEVSVDRKGEVKVRPMLPVTLWRTGTPLSRPIGLQAPVIRHRPVQALSKFVRMWDNNAYRPTRPDRAVENPTGTSNSHLTGYIVWRLIAQPCHARGPGSSAIASGGAAANMSACRCFQPPGSRSGLFFLAMH